MKRVIKSRSYGLPLIAVVATFFFVGAVNAQNANQNTQQPENQIQRFIDVDANRDGFVSPNEYQIDSFAEYDSDQDGKLSHQEYQQMNFSLRKTMVANSNRGISNGRGPCINRGMNRNRGQGINQNKRQGRATGICPYGNECLRVKGSSGK